MRGSLPQQTRISQVHLRTARLEHVMWFYTEVLGLKAFYGAVPGRRATLSATAETEGMLVFSEEQNAVSRPGRALGLYHFALRYSARKELARAYRRIVESGYAITGASDHGVSEAIYLDDPDGNGVELYADRPASEWRWQNGQIAMVTTPLDLKNVLAQSGGWSKTDTGPQAGLGHIHLHVAELAEAERFFSEFLGLSVTQRTYPGALFFAAGAYHHHIGVNVWAGKTAPLPDSAGLISYRLEVPVAEILYCLGHRAPLLGYETRTEPKQHPEILQIRDPNGNWLEVQASEQSVVGHSETKRGRLQKEILCKGGPGGEAP